MAHRVTLIPGDGIGPEVTDAVLRIIKSAAVSIDWEPHDAGILSFKKQKESLPHTLLDSVKRNKVALKGPVTTPIGEATVITLYLLQSLNEKLMPKLQKELKPGSRVVSQTFSMGSQWAADQTIEINGRTVYLWMIK